MIIDILNTLCHESKSNLSEPYTIGDYTYASDALVLVRVPKIKSIARGIGPNPEAIINRHQKPKSGWIDLPEIPDPPVCPRCQGKPKTIRTCHECHGEGSLSFGTDHNTYEVICKSCGGDGQSGGCSECDSTGFLKEEYIMIGSRRFHANSVRKLSSLPGAQIAPTSEHAVWFRFYGGDGLILPFKEARA